MCLMPTSLTYLLNFLDRHPEPCHPEAFLASFNEVLEPGIVDVRADALGRELDEVSS